MKNSLDLQHFILTRFNLLLWQKDKDGCKVRTVDWLAHRFELFEKYCLTSLMNQTRQNFEWIILFDSKTPDEFKVRIKRCQEKCRQLIPVFVEPADGRYFQAIFRREVVKRLKAPRVVTTYLDNDDALGSSFVEDLQARAQRASDGRFINYTDGYQFYTDHKYLLQIHYPRNHFLSVVEKGDPSSVKTIYGYGSHYYIDKIEGVQIETVDMLPMWCEVIHEKNMGNDAYFLFGTRMIADSEVLREHFAINETVKSGAGLYLLRFLPRYIKTFFRRVRYFFFGRHW